MEDTEVYGEIAYKLPFSEAIEKNLLTDYEIFVVGVDDPKIARAIRTSKTLEGRRLKNRRRRVGRSRRDPQSDEETRYPSHDHVP